MFPVLRRRLATALPLRRAISTETRSVSFSIFKDAWGTVLLSPAFQAVFSVSALALGS